MLDLPRARRGASAGGCTTRASRSPPSARPRSRRRSTLVRPVTRRRLYWTARGVFVSDRAHVAAFDAVFRSVFGDRRADEPASRARRLRRAAATYVLGAEQPGCERAGAARDGEDAGDGAEVEVPRAVASDEERLAAQALRRARARRARAAVPADGAASSWRLRCGARAATSAAAAASRIDLRRTLRGEPAHAAASRSASRAAGAGSQRRRLVMLCDTSGSMEPRVARTCSSWQTRLVRRARTR